MNKIVVLLFLSCLNSSIGNCQLLSNPSLTVEDFEIALTDTAHLRIILKAHNFEYSTFGETMLTSTETMPNPIIPDLRSFKSEHWKPKNQGDQVIVTVGMYEWEPNYAPQPKVIKTIRVILRRNSTSADKVNEFFEGIKNKYPNRSKRYFRDSEQNKSDGKSFNVFTNDSKIEVRTETEEPISSRLYIVNFDLIK
jgi:hypothetical protein